MKYRAWNKQKKEWFDLERDYYGLDFEGNLINYYTSCGELMDDSEDYAEVSFFTGIKDRNDKEVYEGDILTIWCGVKQDNPYLVDDLRELYSEMNRDDGYLRITMIEVIGNKYEHPELLEGDNHVPSL